MTVGLVVPCFNEAGRWDSIYWSEMVAQIPARFLFVDDGSADDTLGKIQQIATAENVGLMQLNTNRGKAEAVRLGLLELTSDDSMEAVGYLDADGAFLATDVARLLELFTAMKEQAIDALWSSRVALAGRDIRRSPARHYIGRVIATLMSIGYGNIPYDTQSGYKIFAVTEEFRGCISRPFSTRWLFEIELLARWAALKGTEMKVWEEPLDYWHDVGGSKIQGLETARVIREIVRVKVEQSRSRR